jgi:hypothetical protein
LGFAFISIDQENQIPESQFPQFWNTEMNRIIFSLALASVALLAGDAMAEGAENTAKAKRAQAAEARRGLGGPQRDPANMVARIMQEFDKDGDQKLDKTELTAWLIVMQERRGLGMRRGGKAGKGRPGAAGKRRRGQEDSGEPGGDRPKRPEVE